jgi:dienelactone hydrolase
VLLLGRDGLTVDAVLEEGYRAAGAHVDVHDGSEWLELIGEPERTVGPARTFERVVAWLGSDGSPSPVPRSARTVVSARTDAIVDEDGRVRERALHFEGEAAGMYGVLSEPVGMAAQGVVGVWLGPFRRFVEIGRRWAAQGVPTLRVDLMGSGESDGREPHPLTDSWMYSSDREAHLPAVLDQLVAARAGTHFIVGGYCAGAYWALQAALSDPRVISAMLINLYAIRFSPALAAERETMWTLERLSSRAWRRLSHRELTPTRVRRGVRKLYAGYVRGTAARPLEETQAMEWERGLSDLREREADLLLMLGRNEPLLEEFRRQGLLDRLGEWPNLTVEQMPGNDHLLWRLESQHQLHQAVDEALQRTLAAQRRRLEALTR